MTRQDTGSLTPEETFLWAVARLWRQPQTMVIPETLDWQQVVSVAIANRMPTLLHGMLIRSGMLDRLPDAPRMELSAAARKMAESAALMGESLAQYLRLAAAEGLDTVVLKGLSVSVNVYDDPAMRPGGDIDILVRPADVAPALRILDDMGIGRYWPNLMDDAYYTRHHLHQQRCTPDLKIWFEIHWALDHPLSLLTLDYEAMMDRTTPGELLGEPVRDLAPHDLILSLAIHLVKHAVYLPGVINRPDLPRITLADGMLMYYLDVAETVKKLGPQIDWQLLVDVTRASGATGIVGSVLRACASLLDAPVPDWVLSSLPVQRPGAITRRTMEGIAAYETATYLGEEHSKLWDFLLVTNGAFILRPIRVIDLAGYLLPGRDFLRRRYGRDSLDTAIAHFVRAGGQYARLGVDTLYFTWERYRRLKAMNQSASLFNRLETDA